MLDLFGFLIFMFVNPRKEEMWQKRTVVILAMNPDFRLFGRAHYTVFATKTGEFVLLCIHIYSQV